MNDINRAIIEKRLLRIRTLLQRLRDNAKAQRELIEGSAAIADPDYSPQRTIH
jgi:hypothetical protein